MLATETDLARKRRARRMAKALAEAHPDAHCELDHSNALELAVATILSAQSTDKGVNLVTPKLFARYPTAADYAAADRTELEEIVRPTGFYRNKTDSLMKLGQALVERYDGQVPGRMADLVTLPGIGRKTANVILGNAFDVPGRRVCHARKPACGACTLARWCPSYGTGPTEPVAAGKLLKGPRAAELAALAGVPEPAKVTAAAVASAVTDDTP